MIVIQIFLIMMLLLIAANFMSSRHTSRTKAYKKVLLLMFIGGAIVAVLFPSVTNNIAEFFGVGRGADLLLYGLTIVVIFGLLNNYIKDREEQRRIVLLARKIAILEAVIESKK